ncbi:hypothetical protein ESB00_03885 [Oleiharenicola lentus]|uniref:Uncharacterized protein n=1 Tax=Oleiharenicola lentus TaxID=2508720 RepID=A0A4Q1C876_9BACT|nr:hypothetical protein ESB00_03885 [Oleiharenicola lentus]
MRSFLMGVFCFAGRCILHSAFHERNADLATGNILVEITVQHFRFPMARRKARFRISIKDNAAGKVLKVELIPDVMGIGFTVRQNGKMIDHVPRFSLTAVCERLRRWLVRNSRNRPHP